jgi:hypothetical protein
MEDNDLTEEEALFKMLLSPPSGPQEEIDLLRLERERTGYVRHTLSMQRNNWAASQERVEYKLGYLRRQASRVRSQMVIARFLDYFYIWIYPHMVTGRKKITTVAIILYHLYITYMVPIEALAVILVVSVVIGGLVIDLKVRYFRGEKSQTKEKVVFLNRLRKLCYLVQEIDALQRLIVAQREAERCSNQTAEEKIKGLFVNSWYRKQVELLKDTNRHKRRPKAWKEEQYEETKLQNEDGEKRHERWKDERIEPEYQKRIQFSEQHIIGCINTLSSADFSRYLRELRPYNYYCNRSQYSPRPTVGRL